MSFIEKLLHIAPGSAEKTGLLEKDKSTGKAGDKSGLFGSTLAKFGEKISKEDPKDQKEEIGIKKVKLSRGGLEVEISYPKSLIEKKGKGQAGKVITDPALLHELTGKSSASKERSDGVKGNTKSDTKQKSEVSESLIKKDSKEIINTKKDDTGHLSVLKKSSAIQDPKSKDQPEDETTDPKKVSGEVTKDVKHTPESAGQVDDSDSLQQTVSDKNPDEIGKTDQKKDRDHKVKEEKSDSPNTSVTNNLLQSSEAKVAVKHPQENIKIVKPETKRIFAENIGKKQEVESPSRTGKHSDVSVFEAVSPKPAPGTTEKDSKEINVIKPGHTHQNKDSKDISSATKPVTVKPAVGSKDIPNVVRDRYYGERVVKSSIQVNEGPKDTVEIKSNSKQAIHPNHPGMGENQTGKVDAKAVNSPFSMGGKEQHPGSSSEQQASDQSQKVVQEIDSTGNKEKSMKDAKTTTRTATTQSGNNTTALNSYSVTIPRQLAGKILSMVQKTPSSAHDQQTWQKHRLVMDNGQTLNVSARTTDGVLHLQLSGGNQDLNKLLQQHLQEIRNHLQEQMNVKVDLQFQSQTGGQSAQQFQQQRGNKGTFNDTSIFGNNLNDRTTEAGPDIPERQPLSNRRLGYNNTEWTA